jgi:radical SAM protein with 4Fe4S-binding SPASM domain
MNNPVYVDWAIARTCNLKCRHCVGMEAGELNHDEAVSAAKQIIELAPRWVILEGGEPLLREDLVEIGTMLRQAGIDVYIITNGNAFTEKKLAALATFGPKVLFSFDGADAATYEYVKRGAKFATAIKWAKRCAEKGIFQGITTVLTRSNMHQAEEFIRLAESLGGKTVIFLPLKPFFSSDAETGTYYRQNALTPEEHTTAVKAIFSGKHNLDIFYDEPFLWNLAAEQKLPLSGAAGGITIPEVQGCAAANSLYIQTDGSVRPCMFCPSSLTYGNAAREPLRAIWERMQTSPVLLGWADQRSREGNCAACDRFANCRGCLARTTILTGNHLAADGCCPLVKGKNGRNR